MVGTLAKGNRFEPLNAVVVKDKDDLSIPLDVTTIPSPKGTCVVVCVCVCVCVLV